MKYSFFFLLTFFFCFACSLPQKVIDLNNISIKTDEPTRSKKALIEPDTITNLAFKGGGVKGVAYIGALKVLEDKGVLANLEKVAGTSAGSILAILVALKYPVQSDNKNVKTIEGLVTDLDFKEFEDKRNRFRIFTKYGLYAGDAFLKWMKKQVAGSPLNLEEDATFNDLIKAGGLDLRVFTCNINTHELVELNQYLTPNTSIAEAVRSSMSIPLFFKAWQFSDDEKGDYYVDGGLVYNYPVDTFDDEDDRDITATLGLYLGARDPKEAANSIIGKNHILKYVKNTFIASLQAQHAHFMKAELNVQRTIFIDDFDVSPIDFNITEAVKDSLKSSGKQAAMEYMKHNEKFMVNLKN